MAQMLPMVQIVPEMNLAYDPVTGVLGSSLGSGIVLLSMDDVGEGVAKVEAAADELMVCHTIVIPSLPLSFLKKLYRNLAELVLK